MHRGVERSIGSAASEDTHLLSFAEVCFWPAGDADRRVEYPLPAWSDLRSSECGFAAYEASVCRRVNSR